MNDERPWFTHTKAQHSEKVDGIGSKLHFRTGKHVREIPTNHGSCGLEGARLESSSKVLDQEIYQTESVGAQGPKACVFEWPAMFHITELDTGGS